MVLLIIIVENSVFGNLHVIRLALRACLIIHLACQNIYVFSALITKIIGFFTYNLLSVPTCLTFFRTFLFTVRPPSMFLVSHDLPPALNLIIHNSVVCYLRIYFYSRLNGWVANFSSIYKPFIKDGSFSFFVQTIVQRVMKISNEKISPQFIHVLMYVHYELVVKERTVAMVVANVSQQLNIWYFRGIITTLIS